MEVKFFNRDFSEGLTPPESVEITVERYSRNMVGGCQEATLSATMTSDRWDLIKFLRAPIEIWDDGKCLWWGYVNKITIPVGDRQRRGIGLDNLYNYITVKYADGTTAAGSDTISISEYGQKEIVLSNLNDTQTEAEQARDLYLTDHQLAVGEIEFSGGDPSVKFECYGWYATLGWKYYSNSSNSNVSNTTQLSAIITSAGQFLAGTVIENAAGITSNEYRDGSYTALSYINQLLNAGTSNVRPLLATVDRHRYLHVYERRAQPPSDSPDYLLRKDGKLITLSGDIVQDKECKVGVWVKDQDVPTNLLGFATMPATFIESAEYNAAQDETTYRFSNSYEQVRLSKWVAEVVSGNNSGGGGSTVSYVPYVPTQPSGLTPFPALMRGGTYTTNIAPSGSAYITINDTPATDVNVTYGGLNYMTPGLTDPSGKPAWKFLVGGDYLFTASFYITNGSPIPTSGHVDIVVEIYDSGDSASYHIAYQSVPFLGLGSIAFNYHFEKGDYIKVYAYNRTDGGVKVGTILLTGTCMHLKSVS